MHKLIKRGLVLGSIAAVAYQGFKVYRMIKPLVKMAEELEAYLEQELNTVPKVSCSLSAHLFISVSVTAKFQAEVLQAHPEIETLIRKFIADKYPEFSIPRLQVSVLDEAWSKAEIMQHTNPKAYRLFGKLLEKKGCHDLPPEEEEDQ